jgi:hypothetical protein
MKLHHRGALSRQLLQRTVKPPCAIRSTVASMVCADVRAVHVAGVSRIRLARSSRALARNVLHCTMDESCTAIGLCAYTLSQVGQL